jgi:hypothetical protein
VIHTHMRTPPQRPHAYILHDSDPTPLLQSQAPALRDGGGGGGAASGAAGPGGARRYGYRAARRQPPLPHAERPHGQARGVGAPLASDNRLLLTSTTFPRRLFDINTMPASACAEARSFLKFVSNLQQRTAEIDVLDSSIPASFGPGRRICVIRDPNRSRTDMRRERLTRAMGCHCGSHRREPTGCSSTGCRRARLSSLASTRRTTLLSCAP